MITTYNKCSVLKWILAIIVAINLSMGVSYLYHRQSAKNEPQVEANIPDVPDMQRTRFFREQLNLNSGQVVKFRDLNRDFNRSAWQIQHQLSALRIEMIHEMGNNQPDKHKLDEISNDIGILHTRLKNETIQFYLAMKEICSEEQAEKLNALFMSVLETNEDVQLPQRGRRFRGNMP
jgi:Spy/CpxP family protein refolding chaperone